MQNLGVLGFGGILAAMAALPLATQASGQSSADASLESACRANEGTVPDSCPCTITKARAAGVSDSDMRSLFKGSGHSDTVSEATLNRFWQVKAQCIGDTTMAQMGVSPSNPLPGVPPEMRPRAASPLPPLRQPPRDPLTEAGIVPTSSASSTPSLAIERIVRFSRTERKSAAAGTSITETYGFPTFDLEFIYDSAIRSEAKLFERAKTYTQSELPQWRETYRTASSIRQSVSIGFGTYGSYDRLLTVGVTGSTNNRPQGQFLDSFVWDKQLGREVAWTEVFDRGLWTGRIRRDFCAGLQAERRKRGTQQRTDCPEFDKLLIGFDTAGGKPTALTFTALAYIAGSYAEGPYEVRVPLDASILAGVREPYRAMLGASGQAGSLSLRDRLGEVVLGPPHFDRPPECVTEIFLAPANMGSPGSIKAIRALIARSPGRVFVTGAGMLDEDQWSNGIVLDGTYVELAVTPVDGNARDIIYTTRGISADYNASESFAEVSYGGWSYGELVLTVNGRTERLPALSQSFQCT